MNKTVQFSDIKYINYFEGSRRAPPNLAFVTAGNKVRLTLCYDTFKMAGTLKYLKDKGLRLVLFRSDAELQQYLNGHIDKIPMENKH